MSGLRAYATGALAMRVAKNVAEAGHSFHYCMTAAKDLLEDLLTMLGRGKRQNARRGTVEPREIPSVLVWRPLCVENVLADALEKRASGSDGSLGVDAAPLQCLGPRILNVLRVYR